MRGINKRSRAEYAVGDPQSEPHKHLPKLEKPVRKTSHHHAAYGFIYTKWLELADLSFKNDRVRDLRDDDSNRDRVSFGQEQSCFTIMFL